MPQVHDSPSAIILLSGGLDSTTAAAMARAQGYRLHALTIDYNQRHRCELAAADRVADWLEVERRIRLPVDLSAFGGSALTQADTSVPKDRSQAAMGADIPVTYVPARNTIFLSLALAWAEVLRADAIVIGVNALDYSGYPDCRPEFIAAFEAMARVATSAGVASGWRLKVETPLIALGKAQIIEAGLALGVDYGLTWSCYDPAADGRHCGRCDSCQLRRKGFRDADANDPTDYAA